MQNPRKSGLGAADRFLKGSFAITFGGIVLLLAGCAVGPNYVKPELHVKSNWSVTNAPHILAQPAVNSAWWKVFNDPALEQLIQIARDQNLPLQAAGLRILEARAELRIAIGYQYPQSQQAFAEANRVGLSKNTVNKPPGFTRDFWDEQIGFDVAWEADFWGKYRRAVKGQQAAYMSSVADYQAALVSLSAEVARTYAIIRTFEAQIELSRRNLGVQQESLRIADARFRNGATSQLDVSQARTLLESTRASIPQLELSLAQSQNALCTLLGQPTGSLQNILSQGAGAIPVAPAEVAVGIPAEMLRRRPDVRSAELVAMAQSEHIGIAKADLYPQFLLTATLGLHATDGGGESFNLFNPGSLFYAVGPRAYWNFFDYGRTKNQVRAEDARFQEVLTTYKNSVLKASQEVEDGIVGFLKALEATSSQQEAVTAARRSVALATRQYQDGAVDFQRVLDADRSQLQEENNLVRLRSSVATEVISLYKALGGGWETSAGKPFVAESTRAEMQKRTDWGNLFSWQPAIASPAKEVTPTREKETP